MYRLSAHNKAVMAKKIRHYKQLHFPGKGGGARLAEEIGVAPQAVSNWLGGSRQPTPVQLYRLAIAFKVSPLELCGIRKGKTPPPQAGEVSILDDMLTMIRDAENGRVTIRVTEKDMNDFKSFIEQVLPGIWNRGKEDEI